MNFDLQFDPYNRNYVVTTEVSPELAERLMANPEDRETLAKEIQSAILAAFTHARVVQPEDIKKAIISHRKYYCKPVKDYSQVLFHGKPVKVLGYSTSDALIEFEGGSFATVSWYDLHYIDDGAVHREDAVQEVMDPTKVQIR